MTIKTLTLLQIIFYYDLVVTKQLLLTLGLGLGLGPDLEQMDGDVCYGYDGGSEVLEKTLTSLALYLSASVLLFESFQRRSNTNKSIQNQHDSYKIDNLGKNLASLW